jgi:hypothetical protein
MAMKATAARILVMIGLPSTKKMFFFEKNEKLLRPGVGSNPAPFRAFANCLTRRADLAPAA